MQILYVVWYARSYNEYFTKKKTMARKKVMLLIPNLGLGGAQRVFNDHAVEFAKQYSVAEVVFNNENVDLHNSRNEFISLNVSGGGGAKEKIFNFKRRIQRLKEVKSQWKPDVCISHLEGADYINVLSRQSERLVLCVHGSKLHDQNINGPIGWLRKRLLIPALYRRADLIVTVSQGIRQELVEGLGLPADKVAVINNFFDVEGVQQRAQEPVAAPFAQVLTEFPVLVTAGRFAPEKNLMFLLDIFALVRRQVPACKLLLVGQGELYEALLERCAALGLRTYKLGQPDEDALEADVLFAGFQSNPYCFIARSSVFVLPSRNEGFPMAMGEAMICGTPVAAADCPTGPREILAPDSTTAVGTIRTAEWTQRGVLLPLLNQPETIASDYQVWADALATLLGNTAKREELATAAQGRMQDFTRARIFAQWTTRIQSLIA